ncbi:suppressor of fused domain protein [Kitasatospora azatica]|uniref:suppressor of fused domain protein n=1 Tax=Kitasatospora azatica TaxID=58347 RepID=UPI000568CD83|nr:suppressor of fused domain protein [Kitasatospora azatica]
MASEPRELMLEPRELMLERLQMNERDTPGRLARYLARLTELTGGEPTVQEVAAPGAEQGRVLAVSFADTPEPGCLTAFSYGLSLADRSDPDSAGRELVLTGRTDDPGWATVPATVVAALRGRCPFDHGQAIGSARRLVPSTDLNSLVVAEPVIGGGSESIRLDLSDPDTAQADPVEILGVYPVFDYEREYVTEHGFEALWSFDWDRLDLRRARA